ncbi:Protein MAIN-LIKE 2, partial [Bienertia sinuspersici]
VMNQSRKKNRVHNRAITASARAARASRRSSQHQGHGTDGNTSVINNTNDNAEEIGNDEEDNLEHGKIRNQLLEVHYQLNYFVVIVVMSLVIFGRKKEALLTNANNITADDIARGYLVSLLGCTIFIDKKVDHVSTLLFPLTHDLVSVQTYSWASSALAYLYRELGKASRAGCKQLVCPLTLLEAWIDEYFPMFRPVLNYIFNVDQHPCAMKWDAQTPTP